MSGHNTPDNQAPRLEGEPDGAIRLHTHGHLWRFRCAPGEEPDLIVALADLADRDDTPFDWFDAAVVAYAVNRRHEALTNESPSPILHDPHPQRAEP